MHLFPVSTLQNAPTLPVPSKILPSRRSSRFRQESLGEGFFVLLILESSRQGKILTQHEASLWTLKVRLPVLPNSLKAEAAEREAAASGVPGKSAHSACKFLRYPVLKKGLCYQGPSTSGTRAVGRAATRRSKGKCDFHQVE